MLTATATQRAGSLTHEVDVNGRHTLVTDEPQGLGGADLGPAPHELLPAALASCVSTMIAMYARRKGWELGELSVDVAYDNEADPRTFDVTVHIGAELTADQLQRLERVAHTCPVRRALEGSVTLQERIRAPEAVAS